MDAAWCMWCQISVYAPQSACLIETNWSTRLFSISHWLNRWTVNATLTKVSGQWCLLHWFPRRDTILPYGHRCLCRCFLHVSSAVVVLFLTSYCTTTWCIVQSSWIASATTAGQLRKVQAVIPSYTPRKLHVVLQWESAPHWLLRVAMHNLCMHWLLRLGPTPCHSACIIHDYSFTHACFPPCNEKHFSSVHRGPQEHCHRTAGNNYVAKMHVFAPQWTADASEQQRALNQ